MADEAPLSQNDADTLTRLTCALINTIRTAPGEAARIWFPGGIDAVNLAVTLSPSGVSVNLSINGPTTPVGVQAPVVAARAFAVADESRVMAAVQVAGSNPANLKDCNKFVKAVASQCGVDVDANADADAIVDIITGDTWTQIAAGDNETAMAKAKEGKLVIAGMRTDEFSSPHSHGHIAVVHGHEDANHPGFPHASWGSLDGTGAQAGTVDGLLRNTFPIVDLAKVHYAFRDI
jgi:hypothetical protein